MLIPVSCIISKQYPDSFSGQAISFSERKFTPNPTSDYQNLKNLWFLNIRTQPHGTYALRP